MSFLFWQETGENHLCMAVMRKIVLYIKDHEMCIIYLMLGSHGAKHSIKIEAVILLGLCSFACVRLKSTIWFSSCFF